ncbi:vigilin [Nephila pilipes]|uniref:Vigilin n=1 Tax=Nephila pilipes TaxID=299642 RepID=A0A8X6P0T5_NEPPI|nr:vigilin [Nephila pilipes]
MIIEGITVSFPKIGFSSSRVSFDMSFCAPAQQRLYEIVEDLEVIVIVECILPQEHLSAVLDTRGSKVQNIQRQFNVTIKLPDREKTEDANKVTKFGDAHADCLEAEFQANFETQRRTEKTSETADLQGSTRKTAKV